VLRSAHAGEASRSRRPQGLRDTAILSLVGEHEAAAADRELNALLHHVLLANRFWMLAILGLPFAAEDESGPPVHSTNCVNLLTGGCWFESSPRSQLSKACKINNLQVECLRRSVKRLNLNALRSSRPHWTMSATG
jgi:hypothetical protein